jgi:Sap, sulfolipid-1-addressing protein
VGEVVLFSFASALNPTLLAATTVMLLLPHPDRLMLGYWLGAMAMSIASGLLLIYALQSTDLGSTTKHTLTPAEDFALAAVALIVACLVGSGVAERLRTRRTTRRNKPKKDPRWEQRIRTGNVATAFVLGLALSLPGATYLLLLDRLHKLHYSVVVTTLILIGSNLIQLLVLEVPLLAFAIWPEQTPNAIQSAKAWIGRHGREYAAAAAAVIGVALAVRGVTGAW